jgi:AcrR family transcriptional regulator
LAATIRKFSPSGREQLLDLGAELFAAEPYERVHIERVAEIAGVSRGLLYHYFPTKGAFFAALVERTVENLRAATAPDPALSPLDQLRHGIDAYLAHCRANSHAARAVHRSAASADPDVVAIIERDNRVQEERILGALEQRRTPHPLLVIAVRAWLLFLRTAWLAVDRQARSAAR